MQSKSIKQIRSIGFTKVNRLVRAHAQLDTLRPAFSEWQAGEIYVCKKTGSYRYRFGANSKSPAPWSTVAEELFHSPAEFALAAVVLAPSRRSPAIAKQSNPTQSARANIIKLAKAA